MQVHVYIELKNLFECIASIARSFVVKKKFFKSRKIRNSFIYECSIEAERQIHVMFPYSGSLDRVDEERIAHKCYAYTWLSCLQIDWILSFEEDQPSVGLVGLGMQKIDGRLYNLETLLFLIVFFSLWIATHSMKAA